MLSPGDCDTSFPSQPSTGWMGVCNSPNCVNDVGGIPSKMEVSADYGQGHCFVFVMTPDAESPQVPGQPSPDIASYFYNNLPWASADERGLIPQNEVFSDQSSFDGYFERPDPSLDDAMITLSELPPFGYFSYCTTFNCPINEV